MALTEGAPGSGDGSDRKVGVSFLLTQLGTFAADRFAARAATVGLTPPQAGVLRLIGASPGQSQQVLAAQLGMVPSKLVALLDDLERRQLVERRRHHTDRRLNSLSLTDAGTTMLDELSAAARAHDADITAVLSGAEVVELRSLLSKLARSHELTPGVHPGYRTLGRAARPD